MYEALLIAAGSVFAVVLGALLKYRKGSQEIVERRQGFQQKQEEFIQKKVEENVNFLLKGLREWAAECKTEVTLLRTEVGIMQKAHAECRVSNAELLITVANQTETIVDQKHTIAGLLTRVGALESQGRKGL